MNICSSIILALFRNMPKLKINLILLGLFQLQKMYED